MGVSVNPALDLTIDGLACYRLYHLIAEDGITARPREAVERWADGGRHPKILELLECPWCISMYVAFGIVAVETVTPRAWRPVARALALSTLVGLIAKHADS